jgi:hypothetical protein
MQIPTDPSAIQSSSTRGPSVQWIGVQWQGGFYALPLSSVAAVFKAGPIQSVRKDQDMDIELHDGAPVFMRSFAHCFDLSTQPAPVLVQEEFNWALILNLPSGSPLGCRVHQVLGPFWDELKSECIHHDGHDWHLIQARGGLHA